MAATTKRQKSIVNFAGAIENSLMPDGIEQLGKPDKEEKPVEQAAPVAQRKVTPEVKKEEPVSEPEPKPEPVADQVIEPVVSKEPEHLEIMEEATAPEEAPAGASRSVGKTRIRRQYEEPHVRACYMIKSKNSEYVHWMSQLNGISMSEMIDKIIEYYKETDEGKITQEKAANALKMIMGMQVM